MVTFGGTAFLRISRTGFSSPRFTFSPYSSCVMWGCKCVYWTRAARHNVSVIMRVMARLQPAGICLG